MKQTILRRLALRVLLLAGTVFARSTFAAPLTAGDPILIPDSQGKFDFIEVDPATSRLLTTHTGNKTLDVFDVGTGALIKHCPTGAAQGVAVDDANGKYYVSVSAEHTLVTIDSATLAQAGETNLTGPADIVAFDPKNGMAYVCHDDSTEVWVVDVKAQTSGASVVIPTDPEGILYDDRTGRIYLNIKSSATLVVIDPATSKVIQSWPLAPAVSPHGLAEDATAGRMFAAGGNGKLVMVNRDSGKVIASCDIPSKVDQIAYDPGLKRIYCASGTGVLGVAQVSGASLESLGSVPSHKGAHSVAVDAKSHAVWIAYADGEKSYIQKFTAK